MNDTANILRDWVAAILENHDNAITGPTEEEQ